MPLLPTIFRRCGVRSVILGLAVVYFFAIYIYHSDLSGDPSREGWDKMKIGADAGDAGASLHRKRSRATPRDEDMQRVFDGMRLNERAIFRKANDRQEIQESDADARPEVRRMEQPVIQEPDKTVQSLDDVNIPVGCKKDGDGGDDEFSFQSITSEVFLYSAFWDSRPNDFDNRHNGSYVRIMAIIRSNARPELNCSFGSTDHSSDGSPITSRIGYYEMCENHGRIFGGFILSCPVPPSISSPACSVTIAAVRSSVLSAKTVRLRIRTIDPAPQRLNFAICVPPLFGSINVARLVEFLEVSRVLGAEHVTMYDFELSPEVRLVLDHYSRVRGFVSVIPWKLDTTIDVQIWYHGQLVSIQDCLYRNMASTSHVAFNDIDEFMIPQTSRHWSGMMKVLDDPKRCAFQFKSAFFKPVSEESKAKEEFDIQSLVHFERTSHFDRIRTKCMVKAFSIFEKGIHHVSKPIWADLQVHPVETEVAFLHHYRVCLQGMGMNCASYEEDKTMQRYRDEIVSAVNSSNNALRKGIAL